MPSIYRQWIDQLKLPDRRVITSCSKWAQTYRMMGEPIPGPYTFKYHPWCKEIHDCNCTRITAMKSAQGGLTEVAINRALYTLDFLRRDVLYVLPTKTPDAADFSAARFGAALELSPYIGSMFTNTNKIDLKKAGSCNLYIRGSNSSSGLKSIPVSFLILDEFDEMMKKSIELAEERLAGQFHKTIFALSTPTVPGVGIDELYQKSTKEHFFFTCPHCQDQIELIWPDSIVMCGEAANDPRCMESYLICTNCKHKLDHENKWEYLQSGVWVPTVSGVDNDHRGFHINQMYSSTVSPGELVQDYYAGQTSEIALQEFKNSKLGEAYIGSNARVEDHEVAKAIGRSDYNMKDYKRPVGKLVTMGVDQGSYHNICIVEWQVPSLDYDLNVSAFAKVIFATKVGGEDFEYLDHLMREYQVLHCVIDPDPNINDARRFARRFAGHVTLCQYRRGAIGNELPTVEESGAQIVRLNRTAWMDAALGRFHKDRIVLPTDIPIEFCNHIKSPARVWKYDPNKNPVAEYVITDGPDHYAHALTYAEIALPFAASYQTNRPVPAFL